MGRFDHERLDVYRRGLDFVVVADAIRVALPSGRHALADQLDCAAVSILLNIAEGAGEFAGREKARFYRITRRSATECAAILDVATRLGLAADGDVESAKELPAKVVGMLVRLSKQMEKRPNPSPRPSPRPSP